MCCMHACLWARPNRNSSETTEAKMVWELTDLVQPSTVDYSSENWILKFVIAVISI